MIRNGPGLFTFTFFLLPFTFLSVSDTLKVPDEGSVSVSKKLNKPTYFRTSVVEQDRGVEG